MSPVKSAEEYREAVEAHPPKSAKDYQAMLSEALTPIVDGERLIAVKVFYLCTTDGLTLDVGVKCIAGNDAQLAALATVVREDAQLGAMPHAEQFPTTFVGDQPTRH